MVSLSVALTAPPAVAKGLVLVKPPGGVRVTVLSPLLEATIVFVGAVPATTEPMTGVTMTDRHCRT
jgi:hypothetical protein